MWYSGSSGDHKIGAATSPVSISADSSGNPKDSFNPGETVYAAASWTLLSEGSYTLYVVDNTTWTDQMTIPGRKSGTAETISVNSSGNIPTQAIWSDPPETASYDIVIDVDADGKFDFNYDFVDFVTVTAGFTLPVELSVFTAASVNGNVMLTWRTESEVNNVGFAIYCSDAKDGKYTKIGWRDGAGNSAMPHDYQFLDDKVEVGKTYFYYIEDVDIAGERDKSDIIQITVMQPRPQAVIPAKFALLQNYPNPFNPETWVPYKLAQDAHVTIIIYNAKGQAVRILDLGAKQVGEYVIRTKAAYWNGRDDMGQQVASGVYYYTLRAGNFSATRKMVIVK
jgi:hypothetical protein